MCFQSKCCHLNNHMGIYMLVSKLMVWYVQKSEKDNNILLKQGNLRHHSKSDNLDP